MSLQLLDLSREREPARGSDCDTILRFRASERHLHWAIALPFLVCLTTALVLIAVYNPHPGRPFRSLVSLAHRVSGLCLLALPLLTALRHHRDARVHVHNVRQAWRWRSDDFKWLLLIGPASVFRSIRLPHQDKFNAGEKINFCALTLTYPLLLATGLVIWFGGIPYLSWLGHFLLAALAGPLVVGHILMATVNPDTRPGLSGMISGFVEREWARHHYRHWYEEHYGPLDAAGGEDVTADGTLTRGRADSPVPDRPLDAGRRPCVPVPAPSGELVHNIASASGLLAEMLDESRTVVPRRGSHAPAA